MNKKIIGKITQEVANNCKIPEHANKTIVLYENDRRHCRNEHMKDFKNNKVFGYVMANLDYIINENDFTLFNENNDSLEYYKKLEIGITVRVKIEKGNEMKIKTVFPISDIKYENKRNDAALQKYIIN